MGAEDNNNQQTEPQGNQGEGTQTEPTPPANAEPTGGASSEGEGTQTEPTKGEQVNRHKHEREIGKRDERIKELEAENAKLKGESEGIAKLNKRLDEMEANAKTEKVEAALKAAGCHNIKAAKACLDDYDGDVEKLKEDAPYLFTSSDKSKSTGGNPKGKAGSGDEDEKLDKAFGLK